MSENNQKIAVVALSGGVDSSVVALLLQQQEYKVIGLTGKMVNTFAAEEVCNNAKNVANKLGIEHYVLDVCDKFKKMVIEYFEDSYKNGETPNPCIVCNEFIKWGELFDYAVDVLKADIFATGHYADIRFVDGVYKLYPAKDEHKDQLYFLHRLNQKQLSKTVFPLYEYEKEDVRKIAYDYDLPPKSSKESQDICFIQKPNTTKKYLIEKFGEIKGDFIEVPTGKKLGTHNGHYQYTIGQRKGIGIAAAYPLYVVNIDAERNIVYLGKKEDDLRIRAAIKDLNFAYPIKEKEFDAMVKIRYNMQAKKAKIQIFDDIAEITFYEPVNSITSGQAGVIYDINDGHLIGGGWCI
ncbi:MAG: tRNA 2-thiouridine(34) synthase MnmA [Cyanobacteria bacterium SIG26]|nr:tRNA 2-thiouridine(34) synthase MnmA [Cyanobacteria bacterium SIG26]